MTVCCPLPRGAAGAAVWRQGVALALCWIFSAGALAMACNRAQAAELRVVIKAKLKKGTTTTAMAETSGCRSGLGRPARGAAGAAGWRQVTGGGAA